MFDKFDKESLRKIIAVILISSVAFLTLSILTSNTDKRRQILDSDGGTESRLCNVLSSIKGVGKVEVMMDYDDDEKVRGVIVLAEGGSNPIVANELTNGVSTLYDIPVSSVVVFEMGEEKIK